ncbi:MAG: Gfo/Idh/MocA family protein, partial [Peptostreptococcaceae bacterium]
MKKVKVAVIGAGVRGTYVHTPYFLENTDLCEIVAVSETKKGRRDLFSKKYSIDENLAFESAEKFFESEKVADAVIISTSDDRHFNHIKLALEKGYHVLVEKPMANTLDGLVHLKELATKYPNNILMTCNTLRYSNFFYKLKEIIEDKELGELVSIQYNEEIGYLDYAHSFVRGNLRNSSDTSPVILSRSCDDMDILLYLTGSKSEKVASFGSLKHFNSNSFKLSMSETCYRCSEEEKCPYSCKKIYLENESTINNAVHIAPTKENLDMILKEGPYGR